jgi:acetyl-CoA carboxylase carboxyl transferase subunit alpha
MPEKPDKELDEQQRQLSELLSSNSEASTQPSLEAEAQAGPDPAIDEPPEPELLQELRETELGVSAAAEAADAPEATEPPESPATESPAPKSAALESSPESRKAWERVLRARHPDRPHAIDYIERAFEDFQLLAGDRLFADDAAVLAGYARFRGREVMVIGLEKGRDTKQKLKHNFGMPKPEGYRKALRLMRLAAKFGRPIITLLDTPGAYPGIDAEERGQAEAIARNLFAMAQLEVPVIVVCIGEGGSGGALALGVGNRVLMLENAIYSVISPESCAAIVWRDSTKAELAAEALKLTAPDLLRLGLVDRIVPEPGDGAQTDPDAAAREFGDAVEVCLKELENASGPELIEDRYKKFRTMGAFFEDAATG